MSPARKDDPTKDGDPAATADTPPPGASTTSAADERTTTLPPASGQAQEQPAPLGEVMAHEVDPSMSAGERVATGAAPADRDAAAEETEAQSTQRYTALQQVIHNGRTYHPGAEIGPEPDFTEADAEGLLAAGMIVAAIGAEAAHALYRAKLARHQSMVASGLVAGPPPEPPPPPDEPAESASVTGPAPAPAATVPAAVPAPNAGTPPEPKP